MAIFDFTDRIALFYSRYLEINKPSYIEKIKNLMDKPPEELQKMLEEDDDIEITVDRKKFTGFSLRVGIEFGREECSGDNCEYNEGEHPIIPETLNLHCKMYYSTVFLGRHDIVEEEEDKDWVYSLIKKYTLCSCEKFFVEKDGWCKECYPYVCKQEEECCVCKENLGVWVELKCKHILHKNCWNKIVGLNCPLCRYTHTYKSQPDTI
jgi:hypothetical protein